MANYHYKRKSTKEKLRKRNYERETTKKKKNKILKLSLGLGRRVFLAAGLKGRLDNNLGAGLLRLGSRILDLRNSILDLSLLCLGL